MALRQPDGQSINSIRATVLKRAFEYLDKTPFNYDQWCGSFALKVLHDCGLGLHIPIVEWGSGARLCESLTTTGSPLPGDIVKMTVHYGIFVGMAPSLLRGKWDIFTVDGGTFLDRVYMGQRINHIKTQFYSIERLINGY